MAAKNKFITLTDENFRKEVINSKKPVLIDFWAEWNGCSQIMAPVIKELVVEFEEKIKVGRLDVDNNTWVPAAFGIRTIPTFLIFKDGQVVDQIVGLTCNVELAEKLYALSQDSII